MTDIATSGFRIVDVTSDDARALLKRRYRAEARFRAYGIAAIGFAGLVLILILADIFVKAIPAFTVNVLVMDIPVVADVADPKGQRDPGDYGQTGDFAKLARDALLTKFPNMTDRVSRRVVTDVLSSGAADELRRRVIADPSLIGTTVRVPVVLSTDADLYLKGMTTKSVVTVGRGTATPSAKSGEVTISASEPAFADVLRDFKATLSARANSARLDSDRAERNFKLLEVDLRVAGEALAAAMASGDAARITIAQSRLSKIESDRTSLQASAKEFADRAAGLKTRADAADVSETLDNSLPSLLVRIGGGVVKASSVSANSIKGDAIIPLASTSTATAWERILLTAPEGSRKITDRQIAIVDALKGTGVIESHFNTQFFISGDSREPELAGILGALAGSALTMLVTLTLCLPIGVAAAIYLEEFAPKNRFTDVIEVNINNLAAVPSIVFGLLGLAVFLNFLDLPRSAPLVGGLVLALLVLPTIIIASRAALKAVPPSIREAALGVGASKQQAVFDHVLPLAMPGIMTGTIIGMAHALGETAPLLMIGMIAFIVDVPGSVTEAATVLPVQIFLWSDLPELGFQAKTAAAIIVLLAFLFLMNGLAIILRKRFERRW